MIIQQLFDDIIIDYCEQGIAINHPKIRKIKDLLDGLTS